MLGAAAALSGIMHITVSVVVIMFELTGALVYILPTMIVVGATKAISMYFPHGGIADRMISFNGFPYIDTKEEHTFNVPVQTAMTPTSSLELLPASGISLSALETLLQNSSFQGFPIVEGLTSKVLVGYIGRTELRYAVDRTRKEQPLNNDARCTFAAPTNTAVRTPSALVPPVRFDDATTPTPGQQSIDFSRFVDPTPLTVHPRLPLETAMELFQKMGPRVILVEFKGRLAGLVTVKDCLKYQFKVEAAGRSQTPGVQTNSDRFERILWDFLQSAGEFVTDRVGRWSNGRIRLNGEGSRGERLLASESGDPRDGRDSIGREVEQEGGILDGTEVLEEEGTELLER
jgi:chloride channel 3/4/5